MQTPASTPQCDAPSKHHGARPLDQIAEGRAMDCRRTNHLHREFLSLVEAAIERGDMSIERAAEFMLEHGIEAHVIQRLLVRIQAPAQQQPLRSTP